MKLRGRFTLALALAALVPISVAAVVTREVFAERYRTAYVEAQKIAQAKLADAIGSQTDQVNEIVTRLVSHEDRMIGRLLLDLAKAPAGGLDYEQRRQLEQNCQSIMFELSLDVLVITDRGRVLCEPHAHGKVGESNHREFQDRAGASKGRPYFLREDVTTEEHGKTTSHLELVVEAARLAQDGPTEVAVAVGRRVGKQLLAPVRRADRRADRGAR